ncbi:hypothetical protein PVAP13_1KG342905 [Panicum virgatum]|uniref:Uncharacterized protein n=1 Tax=Panicum virgatum TaxID=38727 RepID=A0A8T0XGY6_PANVG|nr:hypothetical protein PVAP13_1KG342905 [Panicum virgatum]
MPSSAMPPRAFDPAPNCFVPGLLIGFFQLQGQRRAHAAPARTVGAAPAMAAATGGLAPYDELLSSLNGLSLLGGRAVQDLCQCRWAAAGVRPCMLWHTHDLRPNNSSAVSRDRVFDLKWIRI